MEQITQMLVYLFIGLFTGFMSGMFGIGGVLSGYLCFMLLDCLY